MKIIIDELPPTLNKTTQYPSLKWSWIKRNPIKSWTISGPIRVQILFHFTHMNRDIDNYLKAIFDLLQYWKVIKNDNQIFELHAQKKKSRRDFIEIIIEPCPKK